MCMGHKLLSLLSSISLPIVVVAVLNQPIIPIVGAR